MTSWDALNHRIVACDRCDRLREHCRKVAKEKRRSFADWQYWGRPVPNLGDPQARMLIVGLAPAAHGANRTGRMFTGDRSGEWLYRALHKAGLATQAESTSVDDGLELIDCAITAVCHCAPPANKPSKDEIEHCRDLLNETIDLLPVKVFLALGQIGWKGIVDQLVQRGWHQGRRPKFGHGAKVELAEGRWLLGSYHPSQQNTFTGRLTEPMFDAIFCTAKQMMRQNDS